LKPTGLLSSLGLIAAALGGLLGLPAPSARAAAERGGEEQSPADPAAAAPHHAKPRLISERAALIPGKTAFLGITFDIDPGWHLYWDGLSDSGMPIQVAPELPEGFKAGTLLWPTPKRQVLPGELLDYVYEGRVTLILPVTVPETATPGQNVRFAAKLDWLECNDVCLPGAGEVELTLPVAAAGAPAPERTADGPRFDEARARLPAPLPEGSSSDVRLEWSGSTLTLVVRAATSVTFYPRADSAPMVDPIRQGTATGCSLSVEFDGRPVVSGGGRPAGNTAIGVLEATYPGGRKPAFYEIRAPIP
jgi:DsbC/DsbD-like thiol-disulfide interchange protein